MWRDLAPVGRSAAAAATTARRSRRPSGRLTAWFLEQCAAAVAARSSGTASATLSPGGGRSRLDRRRGVLTGSHLDSVLDGGAYDGPLGVVSRAGRRRRAPRPRASRPRDRSASASSSRRRGRGSALPAWAPASPPARRRWEQARSLTDRDGVSLEDAMADVERGEADLLDDVGCFVELHVEQGRDLVDRERPGRRGERDLAARALPLRLHRRGQPRRHDADGGPPRPDADLRDDGARREQAGPRLRAARDVRAASTCTRTAPTPCPSRVTAWLDARAETLRSTSTRCSAHVERLGAGARRRGTAPR